MHRLLLVPLLLAACAHKSLDGALSAIEKPVAGLAVGVDEASKLWEAAVAAQIGICKAKGLGPDATPEQRKACLGRLGEGEKVEPALDALKVGYDQVAAGLDQIRKAAAELQPYLEAAAEAAK